MKKTVLQGLSNLCECFWEVVAQGQARMSKEPNEKKLVGNCEDNAGNSYLQHHFPGSASLAQEQGAPKH